MMQIILDSAILQALFEQAALASRLVGHPMIGLPGGAP
jgi:hypothetical protein